MCFGRHYEEYLTAFEVQGRSTQHARFNLPHPLSVCRKLCAGGADSSGPRPETGRFGEGHAIATRRVLLWKPPVPCDLMNTCRSAFTRQSGRIQAATNLNPPECRGLFGRSRTLSWCLVYIVGFAFSLLNVYRVYRFKPS